MKSDTPHFRDVARTACFVDLKAVESTLVEAVPRDAHHGSRLTHMMLDKSELLRHLIEDTPHYGGRYANLLGEMQLAYMMFMLLYSYPALQHWKLLVSIVCSSESYLAAHPNFTSAFMRAFYSQLNFSPVDFFESELSKENFLGPVISALFSSLDGSGVLSSNAFLLEHKKRLFAFLRKKFNLFDGVEMEDSEAHGGFDSMMSLSAEDAPVFVSEEEIAAIQRYSAAGAEAEGVSMTADSADALVSPVADSSACAVRWAAIAAQMQQSFAAMEVDSDRARLPQPIGVSVSSPSPLSQPSTAAPPTAQLPVSMTRWELEAAQFSWRYPLVYDSMAAAQGREDMAMAAVRIIEETEQLGGNATSEQQQALNQLRLEALRFVEDEVSKQH